MRFIDGVWRIPEGMNVATLHHVFDMATGGSEVVIEGSTCPRRARFEDQDTVYLTVRLFSSALDVIGVRLEHFRGLPGAKPAFAIASDPPASPSIVDEPDFVSVRNGDLAVRVEKRDDWRLVVLRSGRRITGSAPPGAAGYATDKESGRGYKCRLMPYLFAAAAEATRKGLPMMRATALEFPDEPACKALDRQYILGPSLLVAPVFSEVGEVSFYLPEGRWTDALTGEVVGRGRWRKETQGFMSLPLYVRIR